MNKLLQTTLITTIMATSGFSTDNVVAEYNDGLEVKGTLDLHEVIKIGKDHDADIYGEIEGSGTIKCEGKGRVNIYNGQYIKNTDQAEEIISKANETLGNEVFNQNTIVHTVDGNQGGNVAETVTVQPSNSLNKVGPDLGIYAAKLGNNDLVYVANFMQNAGETPDEIKMQCLGSNVEARKINTAFTNIDAGIEGLIPANNLVMENKLEFSGNNLAYTQGKVTIGSMNRSADVKYTTQQSVFPTQTIVESGSKLTISVNDGVTLNKNLTVNGRDFILNDAQDEVLEQTGKLIIDGKITIGTGATLTLGATKTEKHLLLKILQIIQKLELGQPARLAIN